MKSKFWSVALALCLCLTLLPGMARAEDTATTKEVANEPDLRAALTNEAYSTVKMAANIDITDELIIDINRTVTLDLNGYVLKQTGTVKRVIRLDNGTLTLKDSRPETTHDSLPSGGVITGGNMKNSGGSYGGGVFVQVNGTFIMEGGSVFNCNAQYGGGVGVRGAFTMMSGSIVNCDATTMGGGVYVESGATFTMYDGTISGCHAITSILGDDIYCAGTFIDKPKCTIAFDSDGGLLASGDESKIVRKGDKIPEPADPSKVGYTFDGWYNGEYKWNFETDTVTGPMTLTAKWAPNTDTFYNTYHYLQNLEKTDYYTVAVIGDRGTTDEQVTIEPNNYTGFTFNAAKSNTTGRIAGDWSLVLRLYYDRNSYTLTFDTDGGSEAAPITQAYGTAITAPAAPTKPGYIFAGWDKDIPVTMPAENMTITAKWSPVYLPTAPSYGVSAPKAANGTVSVSPANAAKGATVTVTVTPDKGCTLETLTVTDKDGNALPLTDKGGGKYTFTMPGSAVTVTAAFMDDNAMLNFFVDVPASAYYYDAVLWAAENGITGGTDAVHFSPDASCTRAQLVTFLYRAAGSPVVNYAMDFSDVSGDDYYAEAVRWAASLGIVGGYGDGSFGSGDTVTREQVAVMLYRFAKAQGKDVSVGEDTNILSYTDALSISDYAFPAMQWACGAGVMQGTDGSLLPRDTCTRAQIVTLLFRALAEK